MSMIQSTHGRFCALAFAAVTLFTGEGRALDAEELATRVALLESSDVFLMKGYWAIKRCFVAFLIRRVKTFENFFHQ
jgi:hypothetical protein